MSDILDDLKMMADHCDQENDDEPCDLGMLLIRAIAEIRNLRQQPVGEVDAVDGIPVPTGHAEADRLIGRLMSYDPDYDDCADAAALIQREIKGPDGFDTWREAALAERIKRTQLPVSAAEVPMPEPDTHCYDDDVGRDVWSHSPEQMRTYGEQCRAAGYAAGVAAGRKDAERYRAALIKLSCLGNGDRPGNSEGNEIAIAALRGEVK
jgi:hypothetical protein